MKYSKVIRYVAAAGAAAALAACSGQSFDSGETVVMGNITMPAPDKCINLRGGSCSTSNVTVATFQPSAQPAAAPNSSTTAAGVYTTNDITGFLETLPGGDQQTIISLAVVGGEGLPASQQTRIGGLVPLLTRGSVTSKDFNPTTHIACTAGVFLTGGAPTTPCSAEIVRITGPGFLPANAIDQLRTNILEQASSTISAEVVFPAQVACSACAVIICTDGGATQPTDDQCVERTFRSCLG